MLIAEGISGLLDSRAKRLLCRMNTAHLKNDQGEGSMKKVSTLLKRITADQDGSALVEYTVLVGIVTATIMAAVTSIGGWVALRWTNLNTTLNTP
jgi:pilus assembly protein Flp/PilA